MDIKYYPDIVNESLTFRDFKKMNDSKTLGSLGVSIFMGVIMMLTSASIITIMNVF
jgi:hypothetical protein